MLRGLLSRILPGKAKRAVKKMARNCGVGPSGPDQAEILLSLQSRLRADVHPFASEIFSGLEARTPGRTDSYGLRLKEYLAHGQAPWAEDLPISNAFYKDLSAFYRECDRVEGSLAQSMRRLAYTVVPYYHCQPGLHSSDVKNTLPLVGLLPSLTSNRRFVADALNGHARVEELLPDRIVSQAWGEHPHHYPILKDLVSSSLKGVTPAFVSIFPDRDRLVEMLTFQAQLELALNDLMRAKDWKLLIAGDAGMSLPLTVFDLPDAIRPPVAYFEHGLVYGDPYHSMFARADHFLVHGKRDREIWQSLGISSDRMITVGCLTQDHFPTKAYCDHIRAEARLKNGLDDSSRAILYGIDWQADLISRPSTAETQKLVIESLKLLAEKHNIRPVLFLKYHPSPGDPFFYKSRVDYPLPEFLKLAEFGIEVRLASDLESFLPLADCYLAHESTTLGDAIGAAVPTLSLDYERSKSRPTLDHVAYEAGSAHRYLSLRHSPEEVAAAMAEILTLDRSGIHDSCKKVFDNLYDCGRTTGLARFGQFFQNLVQSG